MLFGFQEPRQPQRSRPSFNAKDKEHLYAAQKQKCTGCGERFPMRNLTVDHIKPFSKGGTDKPSNLQLLCNSCDSIKGDGTQAQLKKRLVEKGVIRAASTTVKSKKSPAAATKKKPAQKKPARRPANAAEEFLSGFSGFVR